MAHELVVTAVGPDRPGIAAEFSGQVHAAGANLADSRMMNLRGRFALLALIEGDAQMLDAARKNLRAAESKMGLSLSFSEVAAADRGARAGVPFRLKTYSMDQPGIVHRISSCLREHGVNIEELETHLESAPFMGSPVFTMEVVMLVPEAVSVKTLRRALEEIGDALNCDVDLDPI